MDLTEQQQLVLQTIFDALARDGTWPTVTRVQRLLARESQDIDVQETLLYMPQGLSTSAYGQPDQEVVLTIAGLRACQGLAMEALRYFVRVIRWAAAQYAAVALDESIRVSAAQLGTEWGVPAFAVYAIGRPLSLEPYIFRSGSLGDEWSVEFSDNIRHFASIQSIDDYFEVKDRIGQRYARSAAVNTAVTDVTATNEPVGSMLADRPVSLESK
jgi:hypothetical protein